MSVTSQASRLDPPGSALQEPTAIERYLSVLPQSHPLDTFGPDENPVEFVTWARYILPEVAVRQFTRTASSSGIMNHHGFPAILLLVILQKEDG